MTDGSTVTVVLREDDEEFELTPEEEAGLLESIAAIERGEFVSSEQLLERLCRFGSNSPLEIRVSPQALAEIEEAAEWWTRNRPSAVRDDIAQILAILSTQPGVGAPARRGRVRGVRRVTLTRVRYYLSSIGRCFGGSRLLAHEPGSATSLLTDRTPITGSIARTETPIPARRGCAIARTAASRRTRSASP